LKTIIESPAYRGNHRRRLRGHRRTVPQSLRFGDGPCVRPPIHVMQ